MKACEESPVDPTVTVLVAKSPPNDGREWDCQCARCGSTVMAEECEGCGGEGVDGHDCGEDTCACADPIDNVECSWCEGEGGHRVCLSSKEHCEAHPLPGHEKYFRGEIEWFVVGPEARS